MNHCPDTAAPDAAPDAALDAEPAAAAAVLAIEVPTVRRLGRTDYRATWAAMQRFTGQRGPDTPDEVWLTEHSPVYTLGLAGRPEHLRDSADIEVVHSDRGGQITYHGPGQVVMYCLIDLRRRGLGVRQLVRLLEQAVIDCLGEWGVIAHGRIDAPGVYVGPAKIAALGLKVRRGASYHGLALNVDMDLSPFAGIDPCGYPGLAVTQTRALGIDLAADALAGRLAEVFVARLPCGDASPPLSPSPIARR